MQRRVCAALTSEPACSMVSCGDNVAVSLSYWRAGFGLEYWCCGSNWRAISHSPSASSVALQGTFCAPQSTLCAPQLYDGFRDTDIERTSGLKSVDEEKIRSGTCKPFVYSTIPFTNKVALADKVPVFSYVDGRCPIIKSLPNRLLNDDHRTDQVDWNNNFHYWFRTSSCKYQL